MGYNEINSSPGPSHRGRHRRGKGSDVIGHPEVTDGNIRTVADLFLVTTVMVLFSETIVLLISDTMKDFEGSFLVRSNGKSVYHRHNDGANGNFEFNRDNNGNPNPPNKLPTSKLYHLVKQKRPRSSGIIVTPASVGFGSRPLPEKQGRSGAIEERGVTGEAERQREGS
ncbi:hypothetical protein GWI33_012357 [Rhynchophorus ferrugineus]|uniref:Uncharacterized protein n=1 Tax=Rhynchophorus ferrugineus TaxID=354439 RepID=A0A834IU38_RHYFE|nr:hypothetical protein GWI33_012357 [Rhynchophorus ferrugineus]